MGTTSPTNSTRPSSSQQHEYAAHLWTTQPAAQLQVPRSEKAAAPGGADHHLGADPPTRCRRSQRSCLTSPTSTAMAACPATRSKSLSRGALLHQTEVVVFLAQSRSSWRRPT